MGVAQLDELVNAAGLATFGEPVVFHVSAVQKPAQAIFQVPLVETEAGGVPITAPQPEVVLRKADLVTLAAKVGDFVTVRGKRYRLLAGYTDPVEDVGGMAHVPVASDPVP